nr:MAG TPA: hypothetical protein [Caudoviricetes sp.]DAI75171.1 MAG TPA: hypothetical protein [Caudoviricetes sp.]
MVFSYLSSHSLSYCYLEIICFGCYSLYARQETE